MLHGMAYWRWQVACCYGNSPSYLLTYLTSPWVLMLVLVLVPVPMLGAVSWAGS